MRLQSVFFLAATIIVSLFSLDATATTSAILNAAGDPGFNWTSDRDQESWTYFNVASPVSFNRISWLGSQADANFAIGLNSATCVTCNAYQVSGSGTFANNLLPNSGPFSQVHETLVSGSGYNGLYSYYVDLTSKVMLNSGLYALSIVNNYNSLPFSWAGSSTGAGSMYFNIGQAIFLKGSGSQAFTLTNVSAVPEPEEWALMLAGLSLVGWKLRNKKAGVAAHTVA
jgi:hypothetical protein